jgi:large subunit ribosomal protein L21
MEKIAELSPGDTFVFDKVLLVGTNEYTSIGRPYVGSCKVLATIEENTLSDKVIVFKKKRRKGYQNNAGHRQELTQVRILKVIHIPAENVLDNYYAL